MSDDLMLSDVESVPFDLSQASTIAVEEQSCSSSEILDLNSSNDSLPPLKRHKAVKYVSFVIHQILLDVLHMHSYYLHKVHSQIKQ